jgi:uncharacterized protein (TIGR00730 family)
VFCGAAEGARPEYAAAARALGTLLAERGIGLVTGGGSVGLMGIVADAALAAGGEAIGVIPRHLVDRELGHSDMTALYVVESMHERKALMHELSDAFVALPGGYGTLDELFEALTWRQLGIHGKPVALLDVDGYWEPLVALVEGMVAGGFVHHARRTELLRAATPEELIAALAAAPLLDVAPGAPAP